MLETVEREVIGTSVVLHYAAEGGNAFGLWCGAGQHRLASRESVGRKVARGSSFRVQWVL